MPKEPRRNKSRKLTPYSLLKKIEFLKISDATMVNLLRFLMRDSRYIFVLFRHNGKFIKIFNARFPLYFCTFS